VSSLRGVFFGTLFGLLISWPLAGQLVTVTGEPERVLDTAWAVFIDTSDSASFEQVRSPAMAQSFAPRGNLTFGYLQHPIWLRLTFKNASHQNEWLVKIPAPFLEYIDFYQQTDSIWQHTRSGYYVPHSERAVSHTDHIFPVYFGKDSLATVYVKISGLSPKTFTSYLQTKTVFEEDTRYLDLWYGAFYGILLVMFFYNLFIYLSLRQSTYLLYIITLVWTFLIFACASGYAGKYLWPEQPELNFYFGRLSLGMQAIFLSIFTLLFLEVRRYSKPMFYVLSAMPVLGVVAIVLVATKVYTPAGNHLITISTTLFLITGIVCRWNGNKIATFYIAAWTIYLTGGVALTLRNSGVFEFNFWTTHFAEIGAAMETSIIAFALGDRYRRYKNEVERAQRAALKAQQEATEVLESKVRERTSALSRANEELQTNLETIKKQAETIEHKNAELDAFFYRISHDLRAPISSLMGLEALVKKDVTDKTALQYFGMQHQQIVRLDHIIVGLINLARLNNTDLPKERIDFEKMVHDCIASFRELPNFAAVTFRQTIQPDLAFSSYWILVNAIVQNLIENAIKYGREGDPFVHIRISKEGQHLLIEVEDNGQGISAEHQAKIFEMFYRATENASGSGLGLYILKRSVDRLQGKVVIHSREGEGTKFIVTLPESAS
jgi:signal transduction histidine kinase